MNLEFSQDDLSLLKMLLNKAEVETRVEIHHSKTFAFKDFLKEREQHISGLLARIDKSLSGAA